MKSKTSKKILFAVLNWGLGHACRSIPIIQQLMDDDFEVIIASDGEALELLKLEFPELKSLTLPGYKIKYSKGNTQLLTLIKQIPKVNFAIKKEHQKLSLWLLNNQVDYIISDNRYGIYSEKIPSIFITHQLSLKTPFLKKTVQKYLAKLINHFNYCWVMDDENQPLVPDLSINPYLKIPTKHIGWVTRLKDLKKDIIKYHYTAIISGPEPQRSLFEEKLIEVFKTTKLKCIIIGGSRKSKGNIKVLPISNQATIERIINQSDGIICRSGYTSVMDFLLSNTPFFTIPTPGQTEQEYIADQLYQKFGIGFCQQSKFKNLNQINFKKTKFGNSENVDFVDLLKQY